jgi:hypothetical protein
MFVGQKHGRSHACEGQLEIAADDATMTVKCQQCGETYLVETDALNDGGLNYYVGFLAERKGADE